jgi:hypothetical protein
MTDADLKKGPIGDGVLGSLPNAGNLKAKARQRAAGEAGL